MTREFLKKIMPEITEEQITSILDENGKDLTDSKNALAAKEQEIATITTERDGLKNQIESRDKDIKDLQTKVNGQSELEQQLKDLQGKYDKDTADLNEKLSTQAYDHATEKFFASYEFASDLARKAAVSDFKEQKFKIDETTGEFLGGKDWIENLKKSDPAAFKAEENNDDDNDGNGGFNPYFTNQNGNQNNNPNGGAGSGDNPFNFNFSGVRSHEKN